MLPFFERHPPVVKRQDFAAFSDIVRSMRRKEHLTPAGFERLVRVAYGMNANGKQRARSIGASTCRILRDCTRGSLPVRAGSRDEDTVRPSWRHEELGRNDLAARAIMAKLPASI